MYDFRGYDSNVEVNISNFKSWYKWNNNLAFNSL